MTRMSRRVLGRSCQRTCPLWCALLVLDRGRDTCGWAGARGAWVAGGRVGHQVGSLGKASHTTAYKGARLVPLYTGSVNRERGGVSPAPSTNIMTSATSNSLSGGCRRWSAASSSDTPPGYVAHVWLRWGAVSMDWRIIRACSSAVTLLWREVPDPSPVSRSASPIDSGRPDWLDVCYSIEYL